MNDEESLSSFLTRIFTSGDQERITVEVPPAWTGTQNHTVRQNADGSWPSPDRRDDQPVYWVENPDAPPHTGWPGKSEGVRPGDVIKFAFGLDDPRRLGPVIVDGPDAQDDVNRGGYGTRTWQEVHDFIDQHLTTFDDTKFDGHIGTGYSCAKCGQWLTTDFAEVDPELFINAADHVWRHVQDCTGRILTAYGQP